MNDKPFEYEWIPPDDDDIARGGHLPDKDEIAAKKAEFDRKHAAELAKCTRPRKLP